MPLEQGGQVFLLEALDLPLPLYTPARIHILTDRPLYEAGNTVKFRAIALRANDLSPLEERPGTWRVIEEVKSDIRYDRLGPMQAIPPDS